MGKATVEDTLYEQLDLLAEQSTKCTELDELLGINQAINDTARTIIWAYCEMQQPSSVTCMEL